MAQNKSKQQSKLDGGIPYGKSGRSRLNEMPGDGPGNAPGERNRLGSRATGKTPRFKR